ncbi:MAG: bifunctional DNA-formamidopyrimidine glycosylase/DNA-(apurinic or apyrimidinic site) lyase [Gemmatimonadales bacterium]|nr:MAG: bifunctional DNA-formamidopyrimidine glycosylase/DNA-(apurinic or apyrimidinic site) lyase [Gemmatimonadales bacterium]
MPELPEAETIVRGLRGPLEGALVGTVRVIHADVLDGEPAELARGLEGTRITRVGRRGKNVVIGLDSGLRLVVNLGMSGRLLWRRRDDPSPPPSHPAVSFGLLRGTGGDASSETFAPGGDVVYHDPRRFGRIRLLGPGAWRTWSRGMGPEPLAPGFTAGVLAEALAGSKSPIRSWLLDQRKVAGVGNIYASEACHLARIHPQTPAGRIDADGTRRLHRAVRKVLAGAVAAGGTTLRDYRTAEGWEGAYQYALRAYGREGLPCPRCGEAIVRVVFSNRSAFYCPRCQPEPAPAPGTPVSGSRPGPPPPRGAS